MRTLPARNPTTFSLGWTVFILGWFVAVFLHYFANESLLHLSVLGLLRESASQAALSKFIENTDVFLKDLLCASVAALVLWRWGRRVCGFLNLRIASPGIRLCLETALGILLFNVLWMGLGLELLWREWSALALVLFFCGSAFWDLHREGWKLPLTFERPKDGIGRVLAAMSLAGGFFLFSQAMAPEVYFDALAYHLSTLRSWIFHHGIGDIPGNLYAHFPFGGELYLLNGFFFTGEGAAKLLNAWAAVLAAVMVGSWVREKGSVQGAWLVATLILLCPMVQTTVWAAQNDALMGSFFLLYAYALSRMALGKRGSAWPWVVGLLGGGFFTLKYTAIIGLAAGALPLFLLREDIFGVRRWGEWSKAKALFWLLPAPWFLKNFVFAGNPVYPYLSAWFGGRTLPDANMNALLNDHASVLHLWTGLFPWVERVFHEGFNVTIGPVFLGFLPFLFLPAARRPLTKYLLAATALYLFAGFAMSYQPRLLIPAFFLGFTAMGFVLEDLRDRRWVRFWNGYVLAFGAASLLILVHISIGYFNTDRIWFGSQTREEYLSSNRQTVSYYGLTRMVSHFCRPTDRVLIVGDARCLHYDRDFRANGVFDVQVLARLARQEKDTEGIYRRLRQMGIDDLAVSGEEGSRLARQDPNYFRLTAEEWEKLDRFIQSRTDLRFSTGTQAVYRLRSIPRPNPIPLRGGSIPDLLKLLKTQDPKA